MKHPVRCERDVPATCVCCDSRAVLIAYADGYWGSCSWFGRVREGVCWCTCGAAHGRQQSRHARRDRCLCVHVCGCGQALLAKLDERTRLGAWLTAQLPQPGLRHRRLHACCSGNVCLFVLTPAHGLASLRRMPVVAQMHPDLYDISPDGLSDDDEDSPKQQQQQEPHQQQQQQLSRRAAVHVHYCEPSRLLGVVFADGSAALFSPAGSAQLQAQLVFRRWLCTAVAG